VAEAKLERSFRKSLTLFTSEFHWLLEAWTSALWGVDTVSRRQVSAWRRTREGRPAVVVLAMARPTAVMAAKDFIVVAEDSVLVVMAARGVVEWQMNVRKLEGKARRR